MAPSPTTAEASSTQWRHRRSTVAASKRSVLYSAAASRRPSCSAKEKVRSNWEASRVDGTASARRPGRANSARGVFCSTTMACTSGVRLGSRSGASASTRRLNGTSWWAKASRTVVRTRASSSSKESARSMRVRRTTVLTKKPTRSSSAASSRPETPVPSAISSRPLQRASTSWVRAVTTMKRLAPRSRPSAFSSRASSAGIAKWCWAPAEVRTAGRGRSVGSSSGSRPARRSRQ